MLDYSRIWTFCAYHLHYLYVPQKHKTMVSITVMVCGYNLPKLLERGQYVKSKQNSNTLEHIIIKQQTHKNMNQLNILEK